MDFSDFDEKKAWGDISPGVVEYNEHLMRVLYSPYHIDNDGNLAPAAISTKELYEQGFSVFRKKYSQKSEIEKLIKDKLILKQGDWQLGRLGLIICQLVRELKDLEGDQIFYVYDHAYDAQNYGHAVILCKKPYRKSQLIEFKYALLERFKYLASIDELFQTV